MSAFTPTTRSNPCPICADESGKCRTFADSPIVLCMTADRRDSVPDYRYSKPSKDGLWGIWAPDDHSTYTDAEKQQWQLDQQRQREQRQREEAQKQAAAMPAAERDRQYRKLLDSLPLHTADRANLIERGLSPEQIAAWGVVSVDRWQPLDQELPHTLPGVSLDGRSLNTSGAGYLCPIYDVDGAIVGCQLRLRESDSGRYRWLTSSTQKRPNGATSHLPNGELPLAIHRPVEVQRKAIALTEGTGAKPFITSQRLGVPTIGAAGGQFASSPETLQYSLERLSAELGTRTILFCPDAGAVQNQRVLQQYRATWKLVQQWGYQVEVLWWGQVEKSDRDIDELTDLGQIQELSTAQFEEIAADFQPQNWLQKIQQVLSRKPKPIQSAQKLKAELGEAPDTNVFEYEAGDRLATWQKAIDQGYRDILDTSGTGSGKSFDSGNATPELFGADQLIYISDQHRNPTVDTLDSGNGWVDLEARHGGLTREETPGGGSRLKRSTKGESYNVAPNCNRIGVISALRSKGVTGADSASLICATCPLKEPCQNAEGNGFGFLNQRRSTLSSHKFRGHALGLSDPTEYNYSATVLLWDEPGQSFTVKRDIQVTRSDLEQTIAALLHHPALFGALQPLLETLLSYLDGNIKTGKYGLSHPELVKLLPSDRVDVAAVEAALQPSLNFLNSTAQHGADLADLPRGLRKKFAEKDADLAAQAEQQVLKQWLPDLLRVLSGSLGALHLGRQTLTISLPDNRNREIVQSAKATIFLDATLTREDLALKRGRKPEEIFVCRQKVTDHGNLKITQVTDLGRLGMQRGDSQQERAAALVSHFQALDSTTKAIDFKRFAENGTGAWWRDSRGTNDFLGCSTLILIGTPCRNLADLQAEWTILTGQFPSDDDQQFQAFVQRATRADIHQAIGRLRAHRRPDEQLQVILLTDFDVQLPGVEQVEASSITPEAATKTERLILAAKRAIEHLRAQGEKATQSAIAGIVGCTQARISQLWKFINSAIGNSNSEIYKNSDPPPDGIVQIAEAVIAQCSPANLLESLAEIFLDWVEPQQQRQVWQQLSGSAQTKILEALMLTVPLEELEAIA